MAKIKPCSGLIKWYMDRCGFKGWTSFWNTIYLHPDHLGDEPLIRHELKHIEQIQRDGKIVFTLKYLFWTVKYGYYNNPYEVEAREAEV